VLAAPIPYADFSASTVAGWGAHGWLTTKSEVEPGEADSAFLRGTQWSAFQVRKAYCRDDWSEVQVSVGTT
jgi:hypothetical protein